MHLAYHC